MRLWQRSGTSTSWKTRVPDRHALTLETHQMASVVIAGSCVRQRAVLPPRTFVQPRHHGSTKLAPSGQSPGTGGITGRSRYRDQPTDRASVYTDISLRKPLTPLRGGMGGAVAYHRVRAPASWTSTAGPFRLRLKHVDPERACRPEHPATGMCGPLWSEFAGDHESSPSIAVREHRSRPAITFALMGVSTTSPATTSHEKHVPIRDADQNEG